jgi:5-(hydroxymethyl)furfural/furfural oxidase
VLGLVADGRVVSGVEIERGGTRIALAAREVILSSGALHSPAMLLRAGIGPAGDLRRLGIAPRHDLAGVGRNLQEHPGISLAAYLKPHARLTATRRHGHIMLRYSSAQAGCPESDMALTAFAKSGWHPVGERTGTLLAWINKAESRGAVTLRDVDPRVGPLATFNFLADPRDAARLVHAVRMMAELAVAPPLASCIEHVSPSSYTGFAKSLGRQTLRNLLITAPTAAAIDLVPRLRRFVYERFVAGNTSLASLLADPDALEAYVRARCFGQWHPCGTCRMGDAGDRDAVVSPRDARVHGIGGLRVVDASLMPTAPRANLNVPVMMIAEKMADAIRRA